MERRNQLIMLKKYSFRRNFALFEEKSAELFTDFFHNIQKYAIIVYHNFSFCQYWIAL